MYAINKYNINTVTHLSNLKDNEVLHLTKSEIIVKFIEEFIQLEKYSLSLSKISTLRTSFLLVNKYSKNRYLLLAHFLMGIIKINDFLYYIEKIFSLREKDIIFFNKNSKLILEKMSESVSKIFYKTLSSSKYWFSFTEKKEKTKEKLVFIHAFLSNNHNIDDFHFFLNKFSQLPLKKIKNGTKEVHVNIKSTVPIDNDYKNINIFFDEDDIKQKIHENIRNNNIDLKNVHLIDGEEVYSNKITYEANNHTICGYYYYNKTTHHIDITSVKIINNKNKKHFFRKNSQLQLGEGAFAKVFSQKNIYKQQTIKKKYLNENMQIEYADKKFEICYKIIKDDLLKEFFLGYHINNDGKVSGKALTILENYKIARDILRTNINLYSANNINEDDVPFGRYMIKRELLNRFIMAMEKFQKNIGPLLDIKPENIFVKIKNGYIIEIKIIDYVDFLAQTNGGVKCSLKSCSPALAGTILFFPISETIANSNDEIIIDKELKYIFPQLEYSNETMKINAINATIQIQKNICRYSLLLTILELLGLDIDFSKENYLNDRFNNKIIKHFLEKFIQNNESIKEIIKFMNIMHSPIKHTLKRNYFINQQSYQLTDFFNNFNLAELIN